MTDRRRVLGLVVVAGYLAVIVGANLLTATQPPIVFALLGQSWVLTWGTFLAASAFFLRDAVQITSGRAATYAAIGLALLATIAISRNVGDLAWVTIGSAAAFALSEALDTEVFTRLHRGIAARVAVSGVLGGGLDSAVFAVVGLSPLTTAIVPWELLWTTVAIQVVVKSGLNLVAAAAAARSSLGKAA